ncbi:FadR family transcriptional regulator [Amycolatopsis acidicola]|uniref:FadR family transcriptional regulator n=1 Tax=Amycolatopsis acidicola TaxID=2596893 RepID=A0A5N0VJG3_9PSEU|nr:FCD domain-containing protein [Amycolatopsis acidicola]KAA9166459.1 FadR family transcriptional regulator [Amycolatopsis acidicola]
MTESAARQNSHLSAADQPRQRRTSKISESLVRDIVGDIVARDLRPGAMLPSELEMVERFGVGRASVREALRILEVQGLVIIKPGRGGGPMVAATGPHDFARYASLHFQAARATFRELVEARLALEPMMAGLAAARRDPGTVEALEKAVGLTKDAVVSENSDDYIHGATSFHDVVSGVSGNRVLDLVGKSLKIIYADRVVRYVYPPSHRHMVADSHQEIAEAIIKGRARIAEELMREHMIDYTAQLEERFPELFDEVVDWR